MNGTDHLRRFPAGDPRGAGMAHAIRNETPGSAEPVMLAVIIILGAAREKRKDRK